jgi:hypothetical protein
MMMMMMMTLKTVSLNKLIQPHNDLHRSNAMPASTAGSSWQLLAWSQVGDNQPPAQPPS